MSKVYEYIGPKYKNSMVVNGQQMAPKMIPQNRIPYFMERYPDLKKMFKEVRPAAKGADDDVPDQGGKKPKKK